MTKDEALKLALEALEILDRVVSNTPSANKAFAAIKEALAQPVAMSLPPIVEPPTKSEPVYIMGSYVGTGEVASVTLGGVSFTGNGTAGREEDVKPTGFFFQADKIATYTSDNPEHQKLDLSLCDAKRVQLPVGEVYGWHGHGVGQPLCRFNVTEAEMPVGTQLYITPPQRSESSGKPAADHARMRARCEALVVAMVGKEMSNRWWNGANRAFGGDTPEQIYSVAPSAVYAYLMRSAEGEW